MHKIVKMDDMTFSGCTSLSSVDVSGVHTSGRYVFSGCTSLEKAVIGKDTVLGEGMFYGCTSLAYSNEQEKSKGVVINTSVIPANAFANCGNLKTITFADNLVVNSAGLNFLQERSGFRNLNITGNIFFNNENHWGAVYSWNGGWAPTEYWKFIRFQRGVDSLDTYYENCSIKNNSFYYPLQFFLVGGIDQSVLPEFGNNAYYLAEDSMGFASWIVNPNGGSFEPVFIENAEKFLREYLKDETSTIIVLPGE
jgi:hypothetical protein